MNYFITVGSCNAIRRLLTVLVATALLTAGASSCAVKHRSFIPPEQKQEFIMKKRSMGRLDFLLPEQFELIRRSQGLYRMEITMVPLEGSSAKEIWEETVRKKKERQIAAGHSLSTFGTEEISPGFRVIFFSDNPAYPNTYIRAHSEIEKYVLQIDTPSIKEERKHMVAGAMKEAFVDDYRHDSPKGFNIGPGSLVGPDSLSYNEWADAFYYDPLNNISVEFSTDASVDNDGVEEEDDHMDLIVEVFQKDGGDLKFLERGRRSVAGLEGEHEIYLSETPSDENPSMISSELYFFWVYGGKGEPFKPGITIDMSCPAESRELAFHAWYQLLDSVKFREQY